MCQIHMYRAACGHMSLLEAVSPDSTATTFCEKNPPCKRPTVEIATLFSRCSDCHAKTAEQMAIPNMHRVDISKFKHRKLRASRVPEINRQSAIPSMEIRSSFHSRIWKRLREKTLLPNRQRARQSIQTLQTLQSWRQTAIISPPTPIPVPSREPRQSTLESDQYFGFYDLI